MIATDRKPLHAHAVFSCSFLRISGPVPPNNLVLMTEERTLLIAQVTERYTLNINAGKLLILRPCILPFIITTAILCATQAPFQISECGCRLPQLTVIYFKYLRISFIHEPWQLLRLAMLTDTSSANECRSSSSSRYYPMNRPERPKSLPNARIVSQ